MRRLAGFPGQSPKKGGHRVDCQVQIARCGEFVGRMADAATTPPSKTRLPMAGVLSAPVKVAPWPDRPSAASWRKPRTGPGGGSFVHEVSKERARALLGNYFYFKDLSVADIYQLRRALEPELEDKIAAYSLPAKTLDEEREQHIASLKFHALLAAQAENELLGFLIDFMVNICRI